MKKAIKQLKITEKILEAYYKVRRASEQIAKNKKWANKNLRQNKMLKINIDLGHKNQYQKTYNKILKRIPTLVIKQIKQQKMLKQIPTLVINVIKHEMR